jgi:ATP-grasp domain, R2K clade family 2
MPASSPHPERAVPVLVLSPRYSEDSRVLRSTALQLGWHVERLGNWDVPERLFQRTLIFSGEIGYLPVIAHKLSWALLDAPPDWLLHLSWNYCQRSIERKTLADAYKLAQPAFVKHATGKAFVAGVYASGADLPVESQSLSKTTPVLIAEPVHWEIEFRFFVLERQVMTFSSYWRDHHSTRLNDGRWETWPAEGEEARDFLQTLLADPAVQIPPAIVIDIGKIRGRGWAVIEANAAWAAGIYGCDPFRILPVLARTCVSRSDLSADDARWECNRNARRVRNRPLVDGV